MSIGFYIVGLTCCNDLFISTKVREQVGQDNNQSLNTFIGNRTIKTDSEIAGTTDGKATSEDVSNNVSEFFSQEVSNNATESFNETNPDRETWKSDTNMSLLKTHLQEYLYNMTGESFNEANESHLSLAINATTYMYTDEFLATLTYEFMSKHAFDQEHRISDLCRESEYFYVCFAFCNVLIQ